MIFTGLECFAFISTANIYGYSQVDYSISNKYQNKSKFDITRFNIIGDFNISTNARFLADIELEDNLNATNKGVVGSIKFSQLWGEYSFRKELKLRAGKILTNFGLYNKIHDASPTYYSINSPFVYSKFAPNSEFNNDQRFYGKYIMGGEATGTIDLDERGSQLEYSLMYGKGRIGFVGNTYVESKNAVAARVYITPSFLRGLQIGGSFYTDKNTIGITGVTNDIETIPAVELQYEYKDFQLQSEAFFPTFSNENGTKQHAILGYLHLAYTFFDRLTPYSQISYVQFDSNNNKGYSQALIGLNYAVATNYYIKCEMHYNNDQTANIPKEYGSFKASLSIAF